MCGIVGFTGKPDQQRLDIMLDTITHRGPDDDAKLVQNNFTCGMRRLAIIDLSDNLYPMKSSDGSVEVVFNGEIYNYKELRNQLKQMGYVFKSESDSEVIVYGYQAWGEEFIQKLRGMFAIALYDSTKDQLLLARDRLGIKPLYYAEVNGRLVFASEIKAIFAAYPELSREADDTAVMRFLLTRVHDDTKRTFFANVKRLMPGHYMVVDNQGNFRSQRYWFPVTNTSFRADKPEQEYVEELREKLLETMSLHLIADVPVGVNLSGGLDSSGVVCLANKLLKEGTDMHTKGKLLTFSAVHPGETIDESEYIDEVLKYTGAESFKVVPDVEEFWKEIDTWAYFQEEPTISAAPYAYYTVMREATKHVTVLLSGQGGDELWAGYIPYFMTYIQTAADANAYWEIIRESFQGRDLYGSFIKERINQWLKRDTRLNVRNILNSETIAKMEPESTTFTHRRNLNSRLFEDLTVSTVPNLLRYEDKNSMSHSLESRVPFLDHVYVEHVMSIPAEMKIKNGWNRYLYRQAMDGWMPDKIKNRRSKVGFVNSEWEWLQAKADVIREIFKSEQFRSRKWWNAENVLSEFNAWIAGAKWGDGLMFWRILSTEIWARQYVDQFTVKVK